MRYQILYKYGKQRHWRNYCVMLDYFSAIDELKRWKNYLVSQGKKAVSVALFELPRKLIIKTI